MVFLFSDSKKCIHVLKMLLNYLKYYEMVKKEVTGEAKDVLNAYNTVLEEKNKLDMQHETIKQRSQRVSERQSLSYCTVGI